MVANIDNVDAGSFVRLFIFSRRLPHQRSGVDIELRVRIVVSCASKVMGFGEGYREVLDESCAAIQQHVLLCPMHDMGA